MDLKNFTVSGHLLATSVNRLSIVDSFRSQKDHSADFHFHLHPECELDHEGTLLVITRGQVRVELSTDLEPEVFKGSEEPILGWFSPGYHRKEPAYAIRYRKHFVGDSVQEFEFSW